MADVYPIVGGGGSDDVDDKGQRVEPWRAEGYSTRGDAVAAVLADAPAVIDGFVLENISGDSIGPDMWNLRLTYRDPERKEEKLPTSEGTFSWDTGGGTEHISVSKETVEKVGVSMSNDPPEDFLRAIGVEDDQVNGVDIIVPAMRFDYHFKHPRANITLAYIRTLRDLTGTTNDAEFLGWEAGELLFLGSSGRLSTKGDVEATYQFLAGKNRTNWDIGMARAIDKKAHDYLWWYFEVEEGDTSLVHTPRAAYVERVYDPGDFSALGID